MDADTQAGHVPAARTRQRIGITGHLNLSDATLRLVAAELRRYLLRVLRENAHAVARISGLHTSHPADTSDLTGVSCLARGADSVFAEVLIELGGRLEVILPSPDYRQAQVRPDHAPLFDSLIENAASVQVMPCAMSGPAAYVAANNAMLEGRLARRGLGRRRRLRRRNLARRQRGAYAAHPGDRHLAEGIPADVTLRLAIAPVRRRAPIRPRFANRPRSRSPRRRIRPRHPRAQRPRQDAASAG